MISPEKIQLSLSVVINHSPDGLPDNFADVNDHELVGNGLGVAGVVLVHGVSDDHADELRAAKQVLDTILRSQHHSLISLTWGICDITACVTNTYTALAPPTLTSCVTALRSVKQVSARSSIRRT